MTTTANGVIAAGGKAPPFSLPLLDTGSPSSGREVFSVPPGGEKGLTLVVFYKDSCPTCRLTFPILQRLHEQVAPQGARVIGVSQDGFEGTASFARELGLTFPLAVDGEGYPVSRQYELVSVPTLYLIDAAGVILSSGTGFSKERLGSMAAQLAASVEAAPPVLFHDDESIPEYKPG